MVHKFFLAIILSFFALPVWSQTTKYLTLQESIQIACDSSLQAFRIKNVYMASYWEYRAFRAGRLSSLTLSTTPIRYNRDFTKRYDSESNLDVYRRQQSLYSSANLSISQNIDLTGGTFFIDSELGFLRSFGQNSYSQYSSVPLRIGYYQSLFGFNQFRWERRIEPLKYEKAKKQYLYAKEEISEAVIELFFNLAMVQASYEMARDNVASADSLYRIGQERFKIASITHADILTLELDAINAKNTFKNTEIDLQKSMFNFSSYLHLDKKTAIDIILPQRPKHLAISVDEALQYAYTNNPDFLSFQEEVLEAKQEVDRTKKAASFDANFSVSVGFNQIADNLSGAYKQPLQQDMVAIGLTIPLVDWGVRKGKVNMAVNNLNVSQISVQQKEQSLIQEVVITVSNFNIQQDMINSAEKVLGLATAAYQATKQRFIIGKSDINSLMLALARQKDAQQNYIAALKSYWLSFYKIRKLTLYDFENQLSLSLLFDEIMHR